MCVLNIGIQGWMEIRVNHSHPVRIGVVVPLIAVNRMILECMAITELAKICEICATEIVIIVALKSLIVM